jgi:hypothetical protein
MKKWEISKSKRVSVSDRWYKKSPPAPLLSRPPPPILQPLLSLYSASKNSVSGPLAHQVGVKEGPVLRTLSSRLFIDFRTLPNSFCPLISE